MNKIDSHHHLWKYTEEEYSWIPEDVIRRDFVLKELRETVTPESVVGTVAVQARMTLEETDWLLELAGEDDIIKGVVGWADLNDDGLSAWLEKHASHPKLCALRHVIQEEPDDNYINREDFNRGVGLLKDFGLVYDILIFEKHLSNTIEFVDKHPEQVFVLDHIAKPVIAKAAYSKEWDIHIRELARRENVYCKISGMVTEVRDESWDTALLKPYVDAVLEAFTPSRLMMGSDWPVCLLRASYAEWQGSLDAMLSSLTDSEKHSIYFDSVVKAYNLKMPG